MGIGRLLVKMFPPSAEDVKALHESHSSFDDDDDEYGGWDHTPGVNIDNDIDGGIWGH